MAVVGDPLWNDQMTQLRLRVLKQKLENTRQDRAESPDGTHRANEGTVRFHQAMLRRQELLDQIRSERDKMNERPRSHVGQRRRHEDLSPSRMSLPEYTTSPRHVIQHEFKPVRLDPMNATHVQPTPVVVNQPDGRPFNKGEYMDMMMMQNAQMNQMIMQQMMFSQIPKQNNSPSNSLNVPLTASDLLNLKKSEPTPRPQSVHHHHYDGQTHSKPPPQPPYNYYPHLPPIGGYPVPPPPLYATRYVPAEVEPLRQPREYYR